MKLREVLRYELEHRFRSASTWVYFLVLVLAAFWILGATGDVGPVHVNSPEDLARGSLIIGLMGLLVSAALFGDAGVRDVRVEMDPLLFTSPLRKVDYLGGRFLGALVTNTVVALAIPAGLMLTTLLGFPDPAAYGPFRLVAYVQPFFLFVVPNVVFAGAVLFTVAILARQMVPVYLTAIGLFVSYLTTVNLGGRIRNPLLSMLADPIGFHPLQRLVDLWTAAERNTLLIGFPAPLVWNRVFWLVLAGAVLAVLYRRFRFAHPDGTGGRRLVGRAAAGSAPRRAGPVRAGPRRAGPVRVPRVPGTFGSGTAVRQTLAVARRTLAENVPTRWFAAVLVACVGLTMLWGWNVAATVFEASTWPVTFLVAGTVLSERGIALIYVVVVFYAGEIVWKEREVGTAEIADAAPVTEGVALAGRFLALVAMIVMIQAATIVGGLLIQAFQGYFNFEIGLYLRIVFGLNLPDFVLWAALVVTIHVVVNHKGFGHMMSLGALLFLAGIGRALGIRHHLLLYGTDPGWVYSDMNGFGPFVRPFVWFKLYWAAWALLLGIAATLLWVRGRETHLAGRIGQVGARWGTSVARAGGIAIVLIVTLGGFIFYNTNVLNAYRTPWEAGTDRAELERRYGQYEYVAQPTITDARLHIEIHPEEPAVDLAGTLSLVNRTDQAIDSVHVFVPITEVRALSLDRGAETVLEDGEVGYRIYALEQALAPGDSLALEFEVSYRPRGFRNDGNQTDVVRNGAYFDRRWMPFIGYQPFLELSDERERERYGLPARPPVPSPTEATEADRMHREAVRDADRVMVDAVIGTAADQIAVTPGVLQREWMEKGRRYFHYRTEEPVSFGATVFSARYAVVQDRWNDVALRIFHHPDHTYNLDRTLESMKASLAYYSEQFDAFPSSQLSVVELPRYGSFGRAHPHTIAWTENYFFGRVQEGEIDQAFYGTAHEVAHMWWGGRVGGAQVRGAGFLSESLANYSAMMVMEKTFGPSVAAGIYDFHMEYYIRGRARQGIEMPLLETSGQPYIHYRKGAVAMYALRRHIGEEAVNTALRRYFETFRDAGPPYPTSLDLYGELRAVTPDTLQYVLTDLFETVTLWDVEAWSAAAEPTAAGEYEVTLEVRARKMRADSLGNETDVPMDDLVEVGVFVPADDGGPDVALYLEPHRVRTGEQTITFTVLREPAYAGVDPYNELIDRNRQDNVVEVQLRDRSGGGTPR